MEVNEITEILCNLIEPNCEENTSYVLEKPQFSPSVESSNQQRNFAFLDKEKLIV